jgi:hypothetical protein
MSYETNMNADGTANGEQHFRHGRGDTFGWARRPGFNPYKALAVVAGFVVFPPLGIAALVYFVWNERRFRNGGQGFGGHGFRGHGPEGRHGCGRGRGMGRTGNVAFDEHRAKVLNDLEEERRAFDEHRAEQRRKRDQEAFEAFQAARTKSDNGAE